MKNKGVGGVMDNQIPDDGICPACQEHLGAGSHESLVTNHRYNELLFPRSRPTMKL